MLFIPLPCEKAYDLFSAINEPLAIAPDAVLCVGFANDFGIAGYLASGHMFLEQSEECVCYRVFHVSWAFLTFCRAVSSVKGGTRDILRFYKTTEGRHGLWTVEIHVTPEHCLPDLCHDV